MNEVAAHARVSSMTVSRVLSCDAKVSKETRERVQAAIRELGYSPNISARNLARASTLHLGLIYSNPSAAYLNEFLVGVLKASSHSGCQILLEKCGSRGERTAIRKLLGDGVDGIILPPPLSDSKGAREILRRAGVPFITVASGDASADALSVCIDNTEAAAAMTRYLIELGHRKLGFIRGASNQAASRQRFAGFQMALREAGIESRQEWVRKGDFSYHSGLVAAAAMLEGKHRPTAVFASNDDMAAAAISVAHQLRIDIPEDLTVVGFDDTPLASVVWPALTTIRQPVAAMASKAVELLGDEIRHKRERKPSVTAKQVLDFSLVVRGSSGAAPRKA
jgi:LacI family transcriptional regulator